jgi:hypothetical protein
MTSSAPSRNKIAGSGSLLPAFSTMSRMPARFLPGSGNGFGDGVLFMMSYCGVLCRFHKHIPSRC